MGWVAAESLKKGGSFAVALFSEDPTAEAFFAAHLSGKQVGGRCCGTVGDHYTPDLVFVIGRGRQTGWVLSLVVQS